jgi:tetratricopeptide (TPR) repeat protein
MSDLKDTQPQSVKDTQPNLVGKPSRGRARLFSIMGLIVILALGIFSGVLLGKGVRVDAEKTVVAQQVAEQFQLGVEQLEAGRYELARQHFDYVLQNDPEYPGIQDKITELVRRMSVSPTPTITLTPTITPTPDLREAEAIYASAVQALNASNWDAALASLDSLRRTDPTYRTIDVDGMYYIALRNRGIGKIRAYECADINLEGGIYDLTLAERFGPLDSYADGLRTSARLYLTAASFWQLDWYNAHVYFGQVAAAFPSMMDSSCMMAGERYRFATIEYAKQLDNAADYCNASAMYEEAFLTYNLDNEQYYPRATEIYYRCYGTPVPPTAIPTATLPGGETPSATP